MEEADQSEGITAMKTKFHNTVIEKATRQSLEGNKRIGLTDADQRGLMLRITPNGVRTWVLSCRDYVGRYRMFTIGGYPGMGIAAARVAARSMREDVRRGSDPTAEKRARNVKAAKNEDDTGRTIRALMDEYEALKKDGQKSWVNVRRRLSGIIADVIDVPFARLTFADLREVFENHPSLISAKWGCAQLKPIFRWAVQTGREWVPAQFVEINFGRKSVARKRVLSAAELKSVLLAIDDSDNVYLDAMKFILLTLLRVNEVAGLRWKDVDLDAGLITLPETKNGETHVLPLSRQARQMIADRKGARVKANDPVFDGLRSNWYPAQIRINKLSGTEGWHRHDLRRTGATLLGELGVIPDIVEAALNHATIRSQLAATYNRSRYRPQVAEALQRLADHIDTLVSSA
jgi:integrase